MDTFKRVVSRLKTLCCVIFGHKVGDIDFNKSGAYWCFSAGGYDCWCRRCGKHWHEYSRYGLMALKRSQTIDPRLGSTRHLPPAEFGPDQMNAVMFQGWDDNRTWLNRNNELWRLRGS